MPFSLKNAAQTLWTFHWSGSLWSESTTSWLPAPFQHAHLIRSILKGMKQITTIVINFKTVCHSSGHLWGHIRYINIHDSVSVWVTGGDLGLLYPEEQGQHLRLVFERLHHYGIILKPQKCVFDASSIEFLDHLVDCNGIHPLSDKAF